MGTRCAKCHYVAPQPASGRLTSCPKCGERYELAEQPAAPEPVYKAPATYPHGTNPANTMLQVVAVISLLIALLVVLLGSAIVAGVYFLIFTTAMAGVAIVQAIRNSERKRD